MGTPHYKEDLSRKTPTRNVLAQKPKLRWDRVQTHIVESMVKTVKPRNTQIDSQGLSSLFQVHSHRISVWMVSFAESS